MSVTPEIEAEIRERMDTVVRSVVLTEGIHEVCDGRVFAYDSSKVTACGSAQVTACGSAQVTACDSSRVTAWGSSQVTVDPQSRAICADTRTRELIYAGNWTPRKVTEDGAK